MADIFPFQGIHYDWTRLDQPADVVAPPYDVIDADHQRRLYDRHPANVVRLILNDKPVDGDDNRYDDAARWFAQWLEDGTLTQDSTPAIYVYHQEFDYEGQHVTRRGFMARVRLHPYEDRVVLPHEQTLRGPKVDRLRLNETVGANLSQCFLLYNDPQSVADKAIAGAIEGQTPTVDLTADGIRNTIWTVTDPAVIATIQAVMADQALLIADGHHRYETNLALRDRAAEAEGGLADDDPRRFVLAYLANGADPGLLVLPTHRTIHDLPDFDAAKLVETASADFEVTIFDGASLEDIYAEVAGALETHIAFGLVVPGSDTAWVLRRARTLPTLVPTLEGPDEMKKLDLSILHEHVLKGMLGMTDDDFVTKRYLGYEKGTEAVGRALKAGKIQAALLVNHSPVAEVRDVCVAGGKMPQKSTFFYPKVLSGLVFHGHRR